MGPSEAARFGAGRSTSSPPVAFVAGGTVVDAGAGMSAGTFDGSDAEPGGSGSATRDLQPAHVMNFAPAGTLASETRFCVPQAEQVASIIPPHHTPAWAGSLSGKIRRTDCSWICYRERSTGCRALREWA